MVKIDNLGDLKPVLDAVVMRPGSTPLFLETFHSLHRLDKVLLYYVIENGLYIKLVAADWFDKVIEHADTPSDLTNGFIGNMLGGRLMSDSFLHPDTRVGLALKPDTIIAVYDDGHKLTAEGVTIQ